MSYENTKYKLPFEDHEGNDLLIRIKPKTYSGDPINMKGHSDSPIMVQLAAPDLYQPIKATSCEFKIHAETNTQYSEFKNAQDRDFLIEILRPGAATETKQQGSYQINALPSTANQEARANIKNCLRANDAWKVWTRDEISEYEEGHNGVSVFFSDDGTKMYIAGLTTIYQHNLSEAWNPKSTTSVDSFSVTEQVKGIFIGDSGSKLYTASYDDDKIYEYSLSTAWDITTASSTGNSANTKASVITGIFFKDDGTKAFEIGYGDLYERTLSTPWDLSTISSSAESIGVPDINKGIYIRPDGLQIFVIGYDDPDSVIYWTNLGTAWDITTAGDWGETLLTDDSTDSLQSDLFLKPDGLELFVIDRRQYNYNTGIVKRWSLSQEYGIRTDLKLYVDEDDSGTFEEDEVIVSFRLGAPNYNSYEVINDILQKVNDESSNYRGVDSDGDGLLDTLIKNDDYSATHDIRIHKEIGGTDPEDFDCTSLDGGQSGDTLYIETTEDGGSTTITLASISYSPGLTIQDVVDDLVEQINNSGQDYVAAVNSEDDTIIDIEYTGTTDSSQITLSVSYDPGDSDWDATASGINDVEVESDMMIWRGYNIGNIYQEDYIGFNYKITVRGNDGLPDLKEDPLPYTTGSITLIKLVATALQQTGLKMNINSAYDIWEDGMDTSKDPLSQIYVNYESAAQKGYYQILNEKLKGFRILQDRNEWWITRIDKHDSYDYRKFDYRGNFIKTGSTNPVEYFSGLQDHLNNGYGINTGRTGLLELMAGAKWFDIKQYFGKKDQLIKDPTLALLDLSGNLNYWDASDHSIYSQNEDKLIQISHDESDDPGYIEQINNLGPTNYVVNVQLKSTDTDDPTTLSYPRIKATDIALSTDDDGQYLDLSGAADTEWITEGLYLKCVDSLGNYDIVYITEWDSFDGKAYISESITDSPRDLYVAPIMVTMMLRLDYAKWWNGNRFVNAGYGQKTFTIIDELYTNDWEAGKEYNKKINFSTSNSRDILVRIYQPYNLDMQVNKITQKIPGKFRTGRRIKKYFDELIDEYKTEKKELEFYIGDLPVSYDNATDLFLNGFFLNSEMTDLTDAWITDSFIDVVADRIVNHLGKNGWILTGTFIFKHTIPFRHIIREIGRDEWYICKGAEWYLRSNKVKGEWVEINKGDPGTLISEEKIFEDEPQGVKLYSDNRSSFEAGDGAAQITIEGLEEGDVQEIVKGTIGTFTGADLNSNGGIYIDHGLGFRPVNLSLRRQDKKVEDTNMDVEDMYSDSQIYLQVYVPYEDDTVFTYRVF